MTDSNRISLHDSLMRMRQQVTLLTVFRTKLERRSSKIEQTSMLARGDNNIQANTM